MLDKMHEMRSQLEFGDDLLQPSNPDKLYGVNYKDGKLDVSEMIPSALTST